ncbi:MAG: F0F1 ATP synthase subunit delta [Hyphomicrobium sp.]
MATNEPVMAGVAGRYASALFELASEQSKVAEVEKDLATFQSLVDASDDLSRMIRSPVISAEEQDKATTAILTKFGAGALVVNFFRLLARNRRLFAAPEMARAFRSLAAKARGEVTAEVATATPLTEAQLTELKQTLKASVGKDVALATRVDPALLGGLVVKVGSRMIDSSLRTKLAGLKVAMTGGA